MVADDHERDAYNPPAVLGPKAWLARIRETLAQAPKPRPVDRAA